MLAYSPSTRPLEDSMRSLIIVFAIILASVELVSSAPNSEQGVSLHGDQNVVPVVDSFFQREMTTRCSYLSIQSSKSIPMHRLGIFERV